MHAAARAKTTATSRSKPAADPWQALPGLADLFDSQTPQPFFKGSKVSALEEVTLTETKLLEQTASILGVSLTSSPLNQNPHLRKSYRNRTQLQRSGEPL